MIERFSRALAIDRALGPVDGDGPFGRRATVDHDEREAFPQAAIGMLDALGVPRCYVPRTEGGDLERMDELLAILRVVARRDLTTAIAHGKTFLGAIPVWVAGDAPQRARLARLVLEGAPVALALTERAHGSDLAATETRATPLPDGHLALDGEKWLINNATRARALSVLARTGGEGPRGLSMLLVEKDGLEPSRFAHLPKIRTHGVRGADISGIRFDGAQVPAGAIVGGAPGRGLEQVLRALQVTRCLCAGLSVGALEHALAIVTDFARERRLYGEAVVALPHARSLLAGARVDLAIVERVARAACRAVHVAPEQLSIVSAVAKTLVPAIVDDALRSLAVVLGARHYLREGHAEGAFAKLLRDAALVSVFDGSTVVNLQSLGLLLPNAVGGPVPADAVDVASAIGDPRLPLPALALDRLRLTTRRDDVVSALPALIERVRGVRVDLDAALERLAVRAREHASVVARARSDTARFARSTALFGIAEDHAVLHAAAVMVVTRPSGEPDVDLAVLAIERLLSRRARAEPSSPDALERIASGLERS